MSLNVEPSEGTFPASGGNATFKIVSAAATRMAFKVRTSNNECYRVCPVFGFVEPKSSAKLEVMRRPGPARVDKVVVQWAVVPAEETDPKAPFAAQAQSGEVILYLKAT